MNIARKIEKLESWDRKLRLTSSSREIQIIYHRQRLTEAKRQYHISGSVPVLNRVKGSLHELKRLNVPWAWHFTAKFFSPLVEGEKAIEWVLKHWLATFSLQPKGMYPQVKSFLIERRAEIFAIATKNFSRISKCERKALITLLKRSHSLEWLRYEGNFAPLLSFSGKTIPLMTFSDFFSNNRAVTLYSYCVGVGLKPLGLFSQIYRSADWRRKTWKLVLTS